MLAYCSQFVHRFINSRLITTVPASVHTTWHPLLIWAKRANLRDFIFFAAAALCDSVTSCNSDAPTWWSPTCSLSFQRALNQLCAFFWCHLQASYTTLYCLCNRKQLDDDETLISPDELWGGMTVRYGSLIPWYPGQMSGITSTIVLKVLFLEINCVFVYVLVYKMYSVCASVCVSTLCVSVLLLASPPSFALNQHLISFHVWNMR